MASKAKNYFLIIGSFVLVGGFQTNDSLGEETVSQQGKFICTGYTAVDPENPWRMVGIKSSPDVLEENCPANHVFMTASYSGGSRRPASNVPLAGNCCPVPADFLSDSHSFVLEHCPDNSVATGARQDSSPAFRAGAGGKDPDYFLNNRDQYIRCTKINTEKYQLGPASNGVRVGWPDHFRRAFWTTTTRARIPPALRYGFGRERKTHWSANICVGLPWGSVVTGKKSKYCHGYQFSEIKQKTRDSIASIEFFADCIAIEGYESRTPICVAKPTRSDAKSKPNLP